MAITSVQTEEQDGIGKLIIANRCLRNTSQVWNCYVIDLRS
jgi:hypothetical protein